MDDLTLFFAFSLKKKTVFVVVFPFFILSSLYKCVYDEMRLQPYNKSLQSHSKRTKYRFLPSFHAFVTICNGTK